MTVLPSQGFPQISAPLTGADGKTTQVWYKFFINLWAAVLSAQGNNTFAAGDLKQIAYPNIPITWLSANGQAVSRTTYAALFQAIGTTYGAGDGITTFNVPNFTSVSPVGTQWIIHYGG